MVALGLGRFGRSTALPSLGTTQDPLKGLWAGLSNREIRRKQEQQIHFNFCSVHALPLPPTEDHAWAGLTPLFMFMFMFDPIVYVYVYV